MQGLAANSVAIRSPQWLDQRSLALQRRIAQKLRQEPALFVKVHANLARWRESIDIRSMPYIDAWQALADVGIEACLSMSTELSEKADAMRQCAPFCGILTTRERTDFFKEWSTKLILVMPC